MMLIRLLVIECIIHNVRIYVRHVRTHENSRADSLSRGKIELFRKTSETLGIRIQEFPRQIPVILRDILEFWMD